MCSKSFQAIAVVFLVCVLFGQPAAGQKPGGQQPGGHLRIDEVFVDFDSETITIIGEHFDFGGYLEVTLGEALVGDITSLCDDLDFVSIPQTITCDFSPPATFPPDGDYLLTVATGAGQSQSDEYDLTIGAGGPPGPPGAPGIDGSDGLDGLACWDTNGNRMCDPATEDQDEDGDCDIFDCRGQPGPAGGINDDTCPADEFVTGVTAGRLVCKPAPPNDNIVSVPFGGIQEATATCPADTIITAAAIICSASVYIQLTQTDSIPTIIDINARRRLNTAFCTIEFFPPTTEFLNSLNECSCTAFCG